MMARMPPARHPSPPARIWPAVLLLLGLLAALVPAAASAHAGFEGVDVAPGERVRVEFDAPVETAFLRLEAVDARGRVVSGVPRRDARDPRAAFAPLDAGSRPVTVTWRVLSEDGHAGGGTVAAATGRAVEGAPAQVRSGDGALPLAARLLLLLGAVGVLGMAVFGGWVVGAALRTGGVVAPGHPPDGEAFAGRAAVALEPARRAWWRAAAAIAGVWALGLVLQPVALLWTLRAGAGDLGELLFDTRIGVAWWVQVAAFVVVCATAATVARRRAAWRGWPAPVAACGVAAVAAAVALGAITWSGHASTGKDRTANMVIDWLHNLATGAWVGGLVGMAVVLPVAARRLHAADRLRLSAAVVVRFSAVAVAAVAALVVTGVYRALAELGGLGDLLHTGYGRALLVKLCIFAGLLVMGAFNRFVVHPRLERAALGLDRDDRGAGGRLAVSVRAEVVLAVAVLAAVAVMIGLPPPR